MVTGCVWSQNSRADFGSWSKVPNKWVIYLTECIVAGSNPVTPTIPNKLLGLCHALETNRLEFEISKLVL